MSRRSLFGNAVAACWIAAVTLAVPAAAQAQALDSHKAAVVKLSAQQDGRTRTGTGFIVKREPDSVYIVTAAHVVEGDPAPSVEFFTSRNRRVRGEIIRVEGGDAKGLALLAVRGKDNLPPRAGVLAFDHNANLEGGEAVTTIGFGRGQGDWAVLRMQVISVDGRDLKLDGRIEEGNSGGPVLRDGKVVGLITSQQGIGLATPVQFVAFVLKGWGLDVSDLRARSDTGPPLGDAVKDAGAPSANSGAQKEVEDRSPGAAAPASRPSSSNTAATGQLAWQDHSLRFEGTVREDPAGPVLQAHVFDLLSGAKIGVFDAPLAPYSSQAPALVILSASFNIPGDSVTPQPHIHLSLLHFQVGVEDQLATLVQNCDQLGCYPAAGSLPLD